MKNKKSFRGILIIGSIPFLILTIIAVFLIWAFSQKKDKDFSVVEPKVVHDTVYVNVPCSKNHFECPPIETKKRKVVVEAPTEIQPDLNQPLDTNK